MGNITGKDIGDFQAGVGQVDSEIGVVMSYIAAVFFIILGIVMVIYALIPTKSMGCTTWEEQEAKEHACTGLPGTSSSQICKDATKALKHKEAICNKKTRKYWFLLGILFIPLAIFIVWYAKWWNHFTHTNRTAAQIGGTMAEANIISNMFHH